MYMTRQVFLVLASDPNIIWLRCINIGSSFHDLAMVTLYSLTDNFVHQWSLWLPIALMCNVAWVRNTGITGVTIVSCEHRQIITYYKLLYAYGCKSLIFMKCYLADMYWQFWLAIDFNLHYTHAKVSCFFKHSSRPDLAWLFDRSFDLNISGLCDT